MSTSKIAQLELAKRLSIDPNYAGIDLGEAIPYIREFENKVMVVKVGGSVLEDGDDQRTFLADVAFMARIGIRTVLIHGGSRQLSAEMKRRGMEVRSTDGVRHTEKATLDLAVEVFDEINTRLVEMLRQHSCLAQRTRDVVFAKRLGVDLTNFVGRIDRIDLRPFEGLKDKTVPVLTCLGFDGRTHFNMNADLVASAVAGELKAEKLILLTDVPGVKSRTGELISTLTTVEAENLISQGVIRNGMIPKVRVCLDALENGVHKTHIIDGSAKGSLLCELLSDSGVGTEIVKPAHASTNQQAS